jgi:hypothetical protein
MTRRSIASLAPEEVIGDGSQAVYLYFAETERRLACLEGRYRWPCKIGRTGGDVAQRIYQQGTTACMARAPIVGLSIQTDDAIQLERSIHLHLRLKGAALPGAIGREWFETSPGEVRDLFLSGVASTIPILPRRAASLKAKRPKAERDQALLEAFARMRPSAIATKLGLTAAAVCAWRTIPAKHVRVVQQLTGIGAHLLRPDLFRPEHSRSFAAMALTSSPP